MSPPLTVSGLKAAAVEFAEFLEEAEIQELYGTTDGKALGTWIEVSFNQFLEDRFNYTPGNAAHGIDFPSLNVDLKATYITQPQSSCPFRDASQKIFGLGYSLLVFVYEKIDNHESRTARVQVHHTLYISDDRTGDYQTTKGIIDIIDKEGNKDDIIAFLEDRRLPLDDVGRDALAKRILANPPSQGYITISNALQWRLQYGHAIKSAGGVQGVQDLIA